MSVMKPILNAWLRYTEKPHLARAKDPDKLRRSFEAKARFYFRGPRGTVYEPGTVAGVPVVNVAAPSARDSDGPLILYLHGGAYVFGSPKTHQAMLAQLSARTGLHACLPDYRKAPEHPFPAAIEDAVAVYSDLAQHPGGIILGGDSAGGGLVLALLQEVARLDLPSPLGCLCLSPLTDFSFTTPSVAANAKSDVVLPVSMVPLMTEMVMQDRPLDDPLISPLLGDFTGAPPIWVCVGDTEILEDNARLMAKRLQEQAVETTLVIENDLPHVWPLFHNLLPEARATLDQMAGWISSLPRRSADS
ncbi:alpha/beta hydrolase [Roseovarius sp. 2305UL8-3]|uniref:alpha/beta hydrolase n=1 Tax=Roseovarius conchicola TaxID=3121636 RepID=UPI003529363F